MSVLDSLALVLTHGAKSATEYDTSVASMRLRAAETKVQVAVKAVEHRHALNQERRSLARQQKSKGKRKG